MNVVLDAGFVRANMQSWRDIARRRGPIHELISQQDWLLMHVDLIESIESNVAHWTSLLKNAKPSNSDRAEFEQLMADLAGFADGCDSERTRILNLAFEKEGDPSFTSKTTAADLFRFAENLVAGSVL